MDIQIYYDKAKELGSRPGNELPELLTALDYDTENDHPSEWMPKVQKVLITYFKVDSNSDLSNEALNLYIQGTIMESKVVRNKLVLVGFTCIAFGLLFGWMIWA